MASRKAGRAFWDRLANEIEGDAASGMFVRGRYSTDASMYQCFPAGAAAPKSPGDVAIILEMAREEGLPVIARGGGTSTAGQALGEGIVVDFSKYLYRLIEIDTENLKCTAEPGCPPAAINAALKAHNLIFPVDIASARQATIGGMLGNNSSGIRALRYGTMRDNVASADAFLADGQRVLFNAVSETDGAQACPGRDRLLDLLQFGELHEKAIATLWPLRAPGTPEPEAYDLRTLLASSADQNMARLLAGSEGTLAIAAKIELKLARRPANRALGVCRFADLGAALRLVPKIMVLNPSAIEVLDRTLLEFLAFQAEIRCSGCAALARRARCGFDRRVRRGEPGRQYEASQSARRLRLRWRQGQIRGDRDPRREGEGGAVAPAPRGSHPRLVAKIGGATLILSRGRSRSGPQSGRLWRSSCGFVRKAWRAKCNLWAGRPGLFACQAHPQFAPRRGRKTHASAWR